MDTVVKMSIPPEAAKLLPRWAVDVLERHVWKHQRALEAAARAETATKTPLKLCPFCDHTANLRDTEDGELFRPHVRCSSSHCAARVGGCDLLDAVERWNRRQPTE